MKHLLASLFASITLSTVFSQEPDYANFQVSAPTAKFFYVSSTIPSPVVTEVPPWIIPGGWRSYFFVPGSGETHIRSNPKSLLIPGSNFYLNDGTGAHVVTTPSINSSMDYKWNYYGAYTAQYLNSNVLGGISIGFCHSENKNFVSGGCSPVIGGIQNTINPFATINCSDHDTYSGGSPYIDGWDAYHGLLTACWVYNNESTNWGQIPFSNELGPIAWPSLPYRTSDGRKLCGGFRHPSSILWNHEIYIYVLQESAYGYRPPKYQGVPLPPIVNEDGRQGGTKLLKVHKDEAHDPAKYKVYYNGQWYPSLPAGFNKNNMLNYTATAGPQSTSVIPQLQPNGSFTVPNRFSVAWIRNTNYFAGLEEYFENGVVRIALRISTDLVNWGPRKRIVYEAPSWEKSVMRYPIFLSADGWKNTEIDWGNFYIVGAGTYDNGSPTNQYNLINVNSGGTRPPRRESNMLLSQKSNELYNRTSDELQTLAENTKSPGEEAFLYKIFPNPVEGNLSVSLKGISNPIATISLFDISGRKIRILYNSNHSGSSITEIFDLSDLKSGVYLLEILANDKKYIEKVVKM